MFRIFERCYFFHCWICVCSVALELKFSGFNSKLTTDEYCSDKSCGKSKTLADITKFWNTVKFMLLSRKPIKTSVVSLNNSSFLNAILSVKQRKITHVKLFSWHYSVSTIFEVKNHWWRDFPQFVKWFLVIFCNFLVIFNVHTFVFLFFFFLGG